MNSSRSTIVVFVENPLHRGYALRTVAGPLSFQDTCVEERSIVSRRGADTVKALCCYGAIDLAFARAAWWDFVPRSVS